MIHICQWKKNDARLLFTLVLLTLLYLHLLSFSVNDRPDKVHGIEIYNCEEYIQNRNHWNGAGLLLHEFCHLMHQLVLPNGLHNDDVITMYHRAMESGKYEEVLR